MNAPKDSNSVSTLIAASNDDGITIVPIKVDPALHSMNISDGTTGTDFGRSTAVRDGNGATVIMGVRSDDGVTPIEIYCDDLGNLLVKST